MGGQCIKRAYRVLCDHEEASKEADNSLDSKKKNEQLKNITQVPGELQVLPSREGNTQQLVSTPLKRGLLAANSATHSESHCTLSSVSSELQPWNLLPNFPEQPLILVSQLSACFSIPGKNVHRRSKTPCHYFH